MSYRNEKGVIPVAKVTELEDRYFFELINRAATALAYDLLPGLYLMGYNTGLPKVVQFLHPDCDDNYTFMNTCDIQYWVDEKAKFVRIEWAAGGILWTSEEDRGANPVAHPYEETWNMMKELVSVVAIQPAAQHSQRFLRDHSIYI